MHRDLNDFHIPLQLNGDGQEAQAVEGTLTSMPLEALRDAKQLTQVQMAQLLKISQGAVSKVERRTDMFVTRCAIMFAPSEAICRSVPSFLKATC
jgi:DNA-binding XRE family transcriptional regulator